jgi:tRNA modification GTPase
MVLEAALEHGAVLARAGEFTRRAFLNGKLDLAQAEAVCDLITAKTNDAVTAAANHLEGALSRRIQSARDAVVAVTARLLAALDFPDEAEDIPRGEFGELLRGARETLHALLKTADDGRMIRDGVNAAIIGAPNVGKSSVLNRMSGEDRAIVTDTEGTTRDALEVQINVRGCRVNLLDTAGIRESADAVERLGIARAKAAAKNADLILLVLDGSRPVNARDAEILDLARGKTVICLLNKSDLPRMAFPSGLACVIPVSAVTGEGFDALFTEISERYARGGLAAGTVVTNERHKQALIHANVCLTRALDALDGGQPPDLVLGDLELCAASLGTVDGMTVSDEIVDHIFANFCVGK